MSEITLHDAAQAYLQHLKATGKTDATVYTYGKDFELIEGHFGAERKLTAILPAHVGKFFKSDAFLKKPNGDDRAQPTIDKTRRAARGRTKTEWRRPSGHSQCVFRPSVFALCPSRQGRVVADAQA